METVLLLPVILAELLPERRGLGSVDVDRGGGVDGDHLHVGGGLGLLVDFLVHSIDI